MSPKQAQKAPLICRDCGASMNHHAVKIGYSAETPELKEFHTCPECGRSEQRHAE